MPFIFGVIEVIAREEFYLDEAPVAIDERRESSVININEGDQSKLELEIGISTDSVQETSEAGSTEYLSGYRFPVRFSVRDAKNAGSRQA